jgi:ubiquinone/menaquinone biosynthesis C-methylase UbiE
LIEEVIIPDFSQSRLAAILQNLVSKRREEVGLYKEIAEKLPLADTGRLLDVGTGSGLQLKVIHDIKPGLELFGLDLSGEAIRVAQTHLEGMGVDLRVGSMEDTSYEDDFFDIVTCNASMSYWKNPSPCFDEIYRILKPGGLAMLFEPQKDIDIDEVVKTINTILADKSRFRRFMATSLNKIGLRWGRILGLKLYSVAELEEVSRRSRFAETVTIERTTIQNLPIFVCITLTKPY